MEAERVSRLEGMVEELSKTMDDLKNDISALRNEIIATRNELNGRIDSISKRIDSTNNWIDSIRSEMNNRINGIDKKLDDRFLWILGVQITTWVTIILTLILFYQNNKYSILWWINFVFFTFNIIGKINNRLWIIYILKSFILWCPFRENAKSQNLISFASFLLDVFL